MINTTWKSAVESYNISNESGPLKTLKLLTTGLTIGVRKIADITTSFPDQARKASLTFATNRWGCEDVKAKKFAAAVKTTSVIFTLKALQKIVNFVVSTTPFSTLHMVSAVIFSEEMQLKSLNSKITASKKVVDSIAEQSDAAFNKWGEAKIGSIKADEAYKIDPSENNKAIAQAAKNNTTVTHDLWTKIHVILMEKKLVLSTLEQEYNEQREASMLFVFRREYV